MPIDDDSKASDMSSTVENKFQGEDIAPTIISAVETYALFKTTGVVSQAMARRGPNMLTLTGGAFCPKTVFLGIII